MKNLSQREIEILRHSAKEYTAKEIARFTGLQHRTIEGHMSRIQKKLGAKNAIHAVSIAYQKKLIDLFV